MHIQKIVKNSLALLLLVLIVLPLFIHLDKLPIRLWDESRLAVNALEMYENGDYIVTHYEGEPDMWNTKPPLMIWAQVGCMKLFGVNELSVRLPSALAALLTCLLLIVFSHLAFNDYRLGVIAAFVLVTMNGYVAEHVSRSGDYDALLTLFTTSYCLFFFLYLQKGANRYLHLFFAALALSVITKSIQGLIFLPVLGLYVLILKKPLELLRNKWLYINTAFLLVTAGSYFFLREAANPGYLQAIWENDLGGRYSNDLVEGARGKWYYLQYLANYGLTHWLWFTISGSMLGLGVSNKNLKHFSLYGTMLLVFYLLILSSAQTKLPWYLAPVYPFLSFSVALLFYLSLHWIENRIGLTFRGRLACYLILAMGFLYPYQHILRKSFRPTEEEWDRDLYPISNLLQEAHRNGRSLDEHFICYEEYYAQLLFYTKRLNAAGQAIDFRSFEEIEVGDTIIASEEAVKSRIEDAFDVQVMEQYYNVSIYTILKPKNAPDRIESNTLLSKKE